jgi:hypothetical protein
MMSQKAIYEASTAWKNVYSLTFENYVNVDDVYFKLQRIDGKNVEGGTYWSLFHGMLSAGKRAPTLKQKMCKQLNTICTFTHPDSYREQITI